MRRTVGVIGRFTNGAYLTTESDKDKDQEVGHHVIMLQLGDWLNYIIQIKILAENKETLQLAMKEILQRLEGDLCKIATSKLSDLVIVSKA